MVGLDAPLPGTVSWYVDMGNVSFYVMGRSGEGRVPKKLHPILSKAAGGREGFWVIQAKPGEGEVIPIKTGIEGES